MANRTRQSGMTLIEVLLAMVICAMLMTAIAVAVHASLMSYVENEKTSTIVQTSRALLNRMMTDVRTAQAVTSTATSLTIIPSGGVNPNITEIEYEFIGGKLLYHVTESGVQTTHILIDDPATQKSEKVQVTSFSVLREVGKDWQGIDCTKSITVRLVLLIDDQSLGLSTTAVPRRNQIY